MRVLTDRSEMDGQTYGQSEVKLFSRESIHSAWMYKWIDATKYTTDQVR